MRRTARTAARLSFIAVLAAGLPLTMAAGPAAAAKVKTIKINDVSIVEGDAGSKSLAFTVSWSGSKGGASVSVTYTTADVTATAGSDYTSKTGTVTIGNGGCRCATVSVPVLGDNVFESTETFQVHLSNPVNGVIGDDQGVGTIYDNEGPPAVVATDASIAEGSGSLSMSVVLTSASSGSVTADYTTNDGSAAAGSDYTTSSGTLTFTPGQTTKTVPVAVADDALSEDDETLTLDISNVSGAGVSDAQGIGTIEDDDADPDASVGDAAILEGDAGSAVLSLPVTLSAPAGREVAVDYSTSDVTAASGADYDATSGTVTFPAGETARTVDVPVLGDTMYEGDETLSVTISAPVNANIVTATGTGTITDQDPQPSVSIGDASITEGNIGTATATFDLSLNGTSAFPTSVNWSTADGTATGGTDYVIASGTAAFAAGASSTTVDVPVDGDTVDEPDETFQVVLDAPSGITVADGAGVGTIVDDDRTTTALTLKITKSRSSIRSKGSIEAAAGGMKISVALLQRQGSKYVKIASKTVTVSSIGDVNADGVPDASFGAGFKHLAKGSYELSARYRGDATYLPTSKRVKFRL
jgi:hypothetical protein